MDFQGFQETVRFASIIMTLGSQRYFLSGVRRKKHKISQMVSTMIPCNSKTPKGMAAQHCMREIVELAQLLYLL